MNGPSTRPDWVVLTMGDRPDQLDAALQSIAEQTHQDEGSSTIHVVSNGGPVPDVSHPDVVVHVQTGNLGVPGGRDVGLMMSAAAIVGFLDDDAVLTDGVAQQITDAFSAEPRLGAVSLRLVDEDGATSRRHVPRAGSSGVQESGEVALFLGGASAVRSDAYHQVGGYFTDLIYGHEELELCWRLIDDGWTIRYLADAHVFHPKTEISRHGDGWWLTGRNRVMIARRTLPWPIAVVHVLVWLGLGLRRAPKGSCRRAYLAGWRSGWRVGVNRRPIGWSTVWKLTRLGRPPIF